MNPRERVRAVILDDGKITLIKRTKDSGIYYVFPGGGVESGEDHKTALEREIKEELGLEVAVSDLLMQKNRADGDSEYFYLCKKVGGRLGSGSGPEFQEGTGYEGTHEPVEVSISTLKSINLLPQEVRDRIVDSYVK